MWFITRVKPELTVNRARKESGHEVDDIRFPKYLYLLFKSKEDLPLPLIVEKLKVMALETNQNLRTKVEPELTVEGARKESEEREDGGRKERGGHGRKDGAWESWIAIAVLSSPKGEPTTAIAGDSWCS